MKEEIKYNFKWGVPIGISISLTFMIMARGEIPSNPLVWVKNMIFGSILGVLFFFLQNLSHNLIIKFIPGPIKNNDWFYFIKSFIVAFTGFLFTTWAANNFINPNFFGIPIIQASLGIGLISAMIALFFLSLAKKEARLKLEQENKQLAILKERNRIAQELHDSISQKLFGINLNLNSLAQLAEEDLEQAIKITCQLQQMTEEIQSEMELMIHELQPEDLQKEDFISALENLIKLFTTRYQLNIDYKLDSSSNKLPDYIQLALYRILQEALNNVVQHAQASRAKIELSIDNKLKLKIKDNGRGFKPEEITTNNHFGITGMKERVNKLDGKFKLTSNPGLGTTIKIII